MEEKSFWETIKVEGTGVLERLKNVLHEGNVRKIVVKQGEKSVAVFPLTVGLVGTLFAPILAAVGVLTALLTDCSIEIEREKPADVPPAAEETPEKKDENIDS